VIFCFFTSFKVLRVEYTNDHCFEGLENVQILCDASGGVAKTEE